MHYIELLKGKFVDATHKLMVFGCVWLVVVLAIVAMSFSDCTGPAWYQPEHNACITGYLEKWMAGIALSFYLTVFSWALGVVCALISGVLYALSVIVGIIAKKH
jgi:hypothetical protein